MIICVCLSICPIGMCISLYLYDKNIQVDVHFNGIVQAVNSKFELLVWR